MSRKPMKILIAHHRWWFPTSVSGADIANHEFARRLRSHGMDIRVHGIVAPRVDGRTRQRNYVTDGIRVSLVQSDFIKQLSKIIKEFSPDIILTSCPEPSCGEDDIQRMMDVFGRHSVPVVLYIHDLGPVMNLFKPVAKRLAAVVTNSHFMADKINAAWAINADVIYPVPSRRLFQIHKANGPFVTFFNPLPHKGLNVAHSLVKDRFPDRSFLFVEGFIDPESHGIALARSGNLVHARRSPDVATIYMMTQTLIVPSQWEEPFGRVALEAMYNHIPVIASKTGGLIESVGNGGILIEDFSNVDRWAEAIQNLDDPDFRRQIIEKGSAHIKKFSLEEQMEHFTDIFKRISR